MKTILILGAGTAGTAIAHKLRRRLSNDWDVAVVDPSTTHLYQPGLLFLPFGDETEERIVEIYRRWCRGEPVRSAERRSLPRSLSVVPDDEAP